MAVGGGGGGPGSPSGRAGPAGASVLPPWEGRAAGSVVAGVGGEVLPVTPLPLGLSQAAGRHPLLQKAVSQETPGRAALPASVTEKGPERGHPW